MLILIIDLRFGSLLQVVVVSPLLRALETAAGIFGEPERGNGRSVLMKGRSESDKCPAHPPIFKPSTLDFVATELCRETLDGEDLTLSACCFRHCDIGGWGAHWQNYRYNAYKLAGKHIFVLKVNRNL